MPCGHCTFLRNCAWGLNSLALGSGGLGSKPALAFIHVHEEISHPQVPTSSFCTVSVLPAQATPWGIFKGMVWFLVLPVLCLRSDSGREYMSPWENFLMATTTVTFKAARREWRKHTTSSLGIIIYKWDLLWSNKRQQFSWHIQPSWRPKQQYF